MQLCYSEIGSKHQNNHLHELEVVASGEQDIKDREQRTMALGFCFFKNELCRKLELLNLFANIYNSDNI